MALSEVLFTGNCDNCDLPVFGEEGESGLLLCVFAEGLVVALVSDPLGELGGGGLAIGGWGGGKDGIGEVLS